MESMRFYRSIKDDDSDDDDDSDSDSSCSDKSEDSKEEHLELGFGCFTKDDDVDVDDEDEVERIFETKELQDAIRPFYEGERFMVKTEAHVRDVYFNHPNHPGTEAFVRASQQSVIRFGVGREYDERTYRRMRRALYDSDFFVGKAPDCVEAEDEECDRIFKARYEFDRRMIKKILLKNREFKPIPGTVLCSCCNRKLPEKEHFVMKLLGCFPKTIGFPVLVVLSFFAFGFLYFGVWYVFKTIITTLYVMLGVSISFLMGGNEDDDEATTEGEAVQEAEDRKSVV